MDWHQNDIINRKNDWYTCVVFLAGFFAKMYPKTLYMFTQIFFKDILLLQHNKPRLINGKTTTAKKNVPKQ